jgi:hypothetical protein
VTRTPEVEFLCPECEANCVMPVRADAAGQSSRPWTCPSCGTDLEFGDPWEDAPAAVRAFRGGAEGTPGAGPITRCVVCACPKLYVQKDFNRNAGLLLVTITALISGVVLMITHSTLWAMLVLGIVTVFDAFVYRLLPAVTVCYRCEAVHRGLPVNPKHEGFDIHTAEEFAYGKE